MPSVEPWRIPHWLTPVCDDHPVSHPTRRCDPVRSQRSIVGASPERSARRSTASARPSIWTNTMPGTSVGAATLARRRAVPAMRRSNQASSSSASADDTAVAIAARPMTITDGVQNPLSVDARQVVEHQRHHQRVDHDGARARA